MAERIGVINQGRLIAEGTLAELSTKAGQESGTLEEVFLALVSTQQSAAA
jgi:ABC-2 type transport system ATP-binding protein